LTCLTSLLFHEKCSIVHSQVPWQPPLLTLI
jgi:hypothetical protein